MIKILDKEKYLWYYIIVSTLKVQDSEPIKININEFYISIK